MQKIFQDYLSIFEQFPRNIFLTKDQRHARHQALLKFHHTGYHENITIDELMAFIDEYGSHIMIDNPIFIKKIVPILKQDIDKNGVLALKFLTSTTFDYLFHIYAQCFDELYGEPCSFLEILDKLLALEPDNLLAQEQKYEILYQYTALRIHEVPAGVLFDSNSADIEQTYILLTKLDEFERFTKQLKKPKPPIIDEARFYYLAWIDYLKSTENLDFLAYLQKYHDYQNHEYDE